MAKRRTRKQKRSAKHPFLTPGSISLDDVAETLKTSSKEDVVKDQSKITASKEKVSGMRAKKPMNKADYENLRLIKKHLVKSLSLATIILSLEIVIYLVR